MRMFRFLPTVFLLLTVLLFKSNFAAAYEFPIPELGNCRDAKECHLYCEIPHNKASCWSYSVYGGQSAVLGDETPESTLADSGISFPIVQLGNCASVTACKAYCDQTQNKDSCQAFAQTLGSAHKQRLSDKAQAELGCSSPQECKLFCEQETNKEVCATFAKRYHLKGNVKSKLVDAAKTELGCTSTDECKLLCAQAENRERCQNLAKRINPNAQQQRREQLVENAKEKLGCTSFEDCKAFCKNSTNSQQCRNFGLAIKEQTAKIQEKGNCATVEECRKVCEQNPQKCVGFPKQIKNSTPSGERLKPSNKGPGNVNNQLRLDKQELPELETNTPRPAANVLDEPKQTETITLPPPPVDNTNPSTTGF